jgi:predicted RNase H-like HicB family nuclease
LHFVFIFIFLPPFFCPAAGLAACRATGWLDASGETRMLANRAVVGYTVNMKLSITLDRDEDSIWVAECPAIPGCVSQGKTKPEALKNIKEAIALCMEVRAERGLLLTIETRQVGVLV